MTRLSYLAALTRKDLRVLGRSGLQGAVLVAYPPLADPDRRPRLPNDGPLHSTLASNPWLGWVIGGLLVILILFSLVGALIGKIFQGAPWWARIGLIGGLWYLWRRRRAERFNHETEQRLR